MKDRNLVAGAAFVVLGLVAAYLTSALPSRSLPNTPGPAFFPWIVTILILALAILLIARSLAGPAGSPAQGLAGRPPAVVVGLLVAFVVYLALLPSLGFIVATVPFFAGLMALYGERRPLMVAGGAIAATIGLYVLFRHGFQIILPPGVLRGLVA